MKSDTSTTERAELYEYYKESPRFVSEAIASKLGTSSTSMPEEYYELSTEEVINQLLTDEDVENINYQMRYLSKPRETPSL